jgi:hypothetical protein
MISSTNSLGLGPLNEAEQEAFPARQTLARVESPYIQ